MCTESDCCRKKGVTLSLRSMCQLPNKPDQRTQAASSLQTNMENNTFLDPTGINRQRKINMQDKGILASAAVFFRDHFISLCPQSCL